MAAVQLLGDLGSDTAPDDAWARFEAETGLFVPGSTRSVIGPGMDPAALARYLAARQQNGPSGPQSLVLVSLVPGFTCLTPAALLLLLV